MKPARLQALSWQQHRALPDVLFYVLRNGSFSVITGDMLSEIQIYGSPRQLYRSPENTMAALHKAVNDLADYAEIEVQETRTGSWCWGMIIPKPGSRCEPQYKLLRL